jgi:glycosyltransferase involved in cell wall biosynthesis
VKKVLIISYYWPPSGGAGVQRWLKFAKYLPQFGWQPIIYTPENPDFSIKDESLLKDIPKEAEVIKTKIWEPYHLYKWFSGKKSDNANAGFFSGGKKSWKQKLSIFIRGNFFIPDPRVYWVKPSVKYLKKYIEENAIDAIVSTGPPHSMHLIALGLKKHFPTIKWIADFRDPWTEIDFYHELQLTSWADIKHKRLEKKVIESADEVLVIGNKMAEQFSKLKENVSFIYNGFDEDDFPKNSNAESKDFTIVSVGSMNKDRHHEEFWMALEELIKEHPSEFNSISIKLVGNVDSSVKTYVSKLSISNSIQFINYLSHDKAIEEMQQARLLYLPINNVPSANYIVTGKVFEYMAVSKPILCIGPKESELKEILKGSYCTFGDKSAIKAQILSVANNTLVDKLIEIDNFSRKNLTKQLVQLLEK